MNNVSFTMDIKNELCNKEESIIEDICFLSGFVRNNGIKDKDNLLLTIENEKVALYIYKLFDKLFDCHVFMEKLDNYKKRFVYTITIKDNLENIFDDLSIYKNGLYINKPDDYFLDSDDLKRAYLRGVFFASGSVNDPKTNSYHMEFLLDLAYEGDYVIDLLKYYNISSKVIDRDKGYMVYVKESEKISDFLKLIGANRAVMYFEDIRILRDQKNLTNRLNNCEQANVDKMILSSEKQISDINIIVDKYGLDAIDDKLKTVITYRIKYPDVSLLELANIISVETNKKITKSGINHRMRKIKEMADKIKNNEE